MKITLSYEWAVNLYKKATQFGYKIALDEPHGGYSWHIHLLKNGKRINGIHIQVVKSVWDYFKKKLNKGLDDMEIRIVKVDVYRGMDREINISDFKIIKSRNKFNSTITKWTDYIETYYTCESVKTIYYLSEIMMEELKNNGIECEMILCTKEKIDSFMEKGISFLGIDVIFDGEESVLKNANLKNVLNNNILCSNTKIARNIINIYSDNVDYPEKYFDMWRVYLLK